MASSPSPSPSHTCHSHAQHSRHSLSSAPRRPGFGSPAPALVCRITTRNIPMSACRDASSRWLRSPRLSSLLLRNGLWLDSPTTASGSEEIPAATPCHLAAFPHTHHTYPWPAPGLGPLWSDSHSEEKSRAPIFFQALAISMAWPDAPDALSLLGKKFDVPVPPRCQLFPWPTVTARVCFSLPALYVMSFVKFPTVRTPDSTVLPSLSEQFPLHDRRDVPLRSPHGNAPWSTSSKPDESNLQSTILARFRWPIIVLCLVAPLTPVPPSNIGSSRPPGGSYFCCG